MAEYLIIAGKGALPAMLKEKLPDALFISFDSALPEFTPDLTINFAQVGKLTEFARVNNVQKIIMAGAMQKPDLKTIKPDAEGAILLAKIAAGKFFGGAGDDFILRKVIDHLESKNLKVVGAQEVLPEIVAEKGALTALSPNAKQLVDIEIGIKAARDLGKKDIGQAVVVEDGIIIAQEDNNGTANLIERAGNLKRSYGGVLVKSSKPQQDLRVDLPSIGHETIIQLNKAGISGVAIESGLTFLLERQKMLPEAEKCNIFIFGA